MSPPVTVFFLQASRCIRTVWLLEELGVPYEVKFSDRVNQKAPQEFKRASGNPMGKFPTVVDGDHTLFESGAITEYLCDVYDKTHRLRPVDPAAQAAVNIWIHASESSLMLFGLAVLYARWSFPESLAKSNPEVLEQMEASMSANVHKAMDWLEDTLGTNSAGGWIIGDHLSAADIMTHFSASFLLARQLGTRGKTWPNINAWIEKCEATESYKRAVQKSGYTLYPKTT